MAEPKTQPTDEDPRAFLERAAPEKYRTDALRLIDLFSEVTGEPAVMWGSAIIGFGRYHIPRGKTPTPWPLSGFSPRSSSLTLYVLAAEAAQAASLARLGKHKVSGGCLHIQRLDNLDLEALSDIIRTAHDTMKTRFPS